MRNQTDVPATIGRVFPDDEDVPSRVAAKGNDGMPVVTCRGVPKPSARCSNTCPQPSTVPEYTTRSLSTQDTTVLAPGSNVSCLSTRRETSQRCTSSLLSRMATAIRVPSGETRGTEYTRGGAPTAVSFPLRSIHTSVRRALTAGRYTNVPESATRELARPPFPD